MLYMVIERFKPGTAPAVYERARERGRMLPPGLMYIDSWVDLDFSRCFQLMRTDDPMTFGAWIDGWCDLVDFEVIPVQTSAEASASVSRTGDLR